MLLSISDALDCISTPEKQFILLLLEAIKYIQVFLISLLIVFDHFVNIFAYGIRQDKLASQTMTLVELAPESG